MITAKENIYDCWAFDEPAYCVGGGPGCEGCSRYVPKIKTFTNEDSPFIDDGDYEEEVT